MSWKCLLLRRVLELTYLPQKRNADSEIVRPQCSARAYFDHSYGGINTNISFASWVDFVQDKSYNPNTRVYLGLPAAPDTNVVYDLEMYLQPNEANEIIKALQCEYKHQFGGVMIYEATFSQNNKIHGQPYAVSPLLK